MLTASEVRGAHMHTSALLNNALVALSPFSFAIVKDGKLEINYEFRHHAH